MSMLIQHNMSAWNAERQFNIVTKAKSKKSEKLSSGYRINRAADDAAGLAISEKMRWMIRGLNKGTENVQDGISWVQIGDGSLEETHAMLHRMTELAVKASNGTYTDDDRAMMQAEFENLRREIDRLTDNTTFNEQNIFQSHDWPYHQIEGSSYWPASQYHTVREGDNNLVMTYAMKEGDPLETVSVKVAAGTYTTKELVDEIDSALEEAGLLEKGIRFQYTNTGFCNLNLENGQVIDEVSGGLSYLLYDNFNGGTLGALIGTTVFPDNDTKVLLVEHGQNGHMEFQLLDPEDSTIKTPITIDLQDGMYSKKELIDQLNTAMADALTANGKSGKVEATSEGNIIKISSPDYIVSEFQGNMFTIDGGLYSSVFYDNIKYADRIDRFPAQLQGGYVVRDAAYNQAADPEGSVFHFSAGDRLVMNPNGRGELIIDMEPMNHKTIDEVITYLQQKFDDFEYTDEDGNTQKGAGLTVSKYNGSIEYVYTKPNASYYDREATRLAGLNIVSQVKGLESTIGIDKTKSTAYAALFTSKRVTDYQWKATFGENDTTVDTNDYLLGLRTLGGMTIKAGENDAFEIRLSSGDWKTITLDEGTYADAGALAAEIQKQADAVYGAHMLEITPTTAGGGVPANRIRIEAASSDVKGIEVRAHQEDDGTTNIGYQEIFQGRTDDPVTESAPAAHKATILLPEIKTLNADGKITISPGEGNFAVTVNGKERAVNLAGTWTLAELEKKIEDAFPKTDEAYRFNDINAAGYTTTRTVSASSNSGGRTQSTAGNYSNYSKKQGYTESNEGDPSRPSVNTGAAITFYSALPSSITITDANKDFTFILNGDTHTIDLKTLGNTDHSYNRDDFKNKLQAAITKELGKGPDQYGGLKVEMSSSGVLTLTAGLNLDGGGQYVGQKTSLEMVVNQKGGFIYNLHDNSTAATASLSATQSSDAPGSVGSTTIYANTAFTGTGTVRLKLTKPGGGSETIDVSVDGATSYSDLRTKLNQWFSDHNKNITASVTSTGVTFSTTGDWKADGYKLEIDTANSSLKEKLFGFADDGYKLEKKTGASATTSIAMTSEQPIKFDADQTFEMTVDGIKKTVKINKNTAGYTADGMVTELQRALNEAFGNDKVKVTKTSGGSLTFTTVSKNGKNSSIVLGYQEKNGTNPTALRTIFGARKIGGVDASFENVTDKDGNPAVQLRLTRISYDANNPNDKGNISVTSNTLSIPNSYGERYSTYKGGSFIRPNLIYSSPKAAAGYHSDDNSYLQGVQLMPTDGKVEIDEFNKHLSFYYSDNYGSAGNVPKHIEFDLEEMKYTPDQLVSALQTKIDDIIGANRLKVMIERGGIRIETAAKYTGSKYRIHTDWTSEPTNLRPSGTFYEKILCGSRLSKVYTKPIVDQEGKQTGASVYAMGRQDVKNTTTKIQRDGNDTLSLRFTTPDAPDGITLEMVLDPGYYSGDELAAQIQEKLDQALEKAGLKKGMIEAVIGYEDPDVQKVTGAIDDKALAFKLSENVAVPKDGKYVIDTIGGTAAFSVFYATDGDIARAYVRGGKDISGGVKIKEGQNTLSVEVDDESYEITLDAGQYTAPDLINHINDKLKDESVPLKAYVDEGRLKIMHVKYGQHTIKHLGGGVKNQLLFRESGVLDDDQPMRVKVSGVEGDYIDVEKPWMDTSALGINTLTVEKYKNAQKAIKRLKSAVTKVSEVRSYFGAMQNRLESTARNNMNKAENTTAAESRIRDADFSKEAVDNAIQNIIEQAGVSVMTQTMQNANLALQLLS